MGGSPGLRKNNPFRVIWTKIAERIIVSVTAMHQSKRSDETIKQMIQTEPGWYMEEEHPGGYKYHRVLFWVLLENAKFGDITRLTGITQFDINDELLSFPPHFKAVYLPQLDSSVVHSESKLGED
jgi:hypothetical protein